MARKSPPPSGRRAPQGRSGFTLAGAQERVDDLDAISGKQRFGGAEEFVDVLEKGLDRVERKLKRIDRSLKRDGSIFAPNTAKGFSKGLQDGARAWERVARASRSLMPNARAGARHYASMAGGAMMHGMGQLGGWMGGHIQRSAAWQRMAPWANRAMGYMQAGWNGVSPWMGRAAGFMGGMGRAGWDRVSQITGSAWERSKGYAALSGRALANAAITAPRNIATWGLEKYRQGIGLYMNQQAARGQSEALGGRRVRGIEGDAYAYGYRRTEAQQAYQQMMLARGERGARSGARSSLALSRGFGIDQASIFSMQRASRDAGDSSGADQINNALVASFRRTKFPRAFLGEFLQQSTRLMGQMSQGRESVKGSEAFGLLSTFSRTMGGVYGHSPTRSADLLSRVGGTIANPGGGEAGESFMLRAMGFGSGSSYVQAKMRGEQGMTGDNIRRLLKQVRGEYGSMGKEGQALAMHRLSGGRLKLFETMRLIGLDPDSMSDTNIKEAISGSQRVDLAKEGRMSSKRLGAQKRMIGRENQLAEFAAANQKIANTFFEAEKTIMNAATKLATGLNTLLGGVDGLSKTFGSLNTQINKWSDSFSGWWGGKKSTKSKPGRRPNGSGDTPGL